VTAKPTLFDAWWTDTATGRRLWRATRAELAEANRLWWKYQNIRRSGGGKRYARVVVIGDSDDESSKAPRSGELHEAPGALRLGRGSSATATVRRYRRFPAETVSRCRVS
jgi:hypothetical protein